MNTENVKPINNRMLVGSRVARVLYQLGIDQGQFENLYETLPRDRSSRETLAAKIAALEAENAALREKVNQESVSI